MLPAQLDKELELMDVNLKKLGKPGTSKGELLRFYGVIILISCLHQTWHGFGSPKVKNPAHLPWQNHDKIDLHRRHHPAVTQPPIPKS
jgi:hypothetical protein